MMSLAHAEVAEGRVVVGFLPVALQRTPPTQILEQIARLNCRVASPRSALSWWCAMATSACPTSLSTPTPVRSRP